MKRLEHILVIVDPSAGERQAAVDKATLLARPFASTVELLICDIESARADAAFIRKPWDTNPSNMQLLDLLDALAAPLRAQGIKVGVQLIYGNSLHQSLLDFIRGSNAQLVIKDTHHHSLAKRTFLANTDWYLAHGSPMSLMLTKKNDWGRPPTIMAAIDPDRSEDGKDAGVLQCAATIAGRLAGDLHIVHSFVPAAFAHAILTGTAGMNREYIEALQVENSYRRCQMEHLISGHGVSPRCLHVEMGPPRDSLVYGVKRHHGDMLVVGASSHGRWHRMLFGSTTSAIVESLPCDILIVNGHYPHETEESPE